MSNGSESAGGSSDPSHHVPAKAERERDASDFALEEDELHSDSVISPVTAVSTVEEHLTAPGDSTVTSSNAPTVPQTHSATDGVHVDVGDRDDDLTVMNRTGEAASSYGMSPLANSEGVEDDRVIITQLLASNDALRSQLGQFKVALQQSLATGPSHRGLPRQEAEELRANSPYNMGGSPARSPNKHVKLNHAMVLSVPALDKQLALVHRRTQMYVESNQKLQQRIQKLTDGRYIKKLEEQVAKLQEQVVAVGEENKALRSQQRDADKAAMKEYKDRQNFPEKLNAAKSDLRVQKNRLKKQTEQITDLQKKERVQSTKLKVLREENAKLAQGLEEAGIDVTKLLTMKLEQVVAPDLPLRGEEHAAEVERQQAALREERDKLAEDVRALGRIMTGYRSKGAREIKTMQAQVQKYRAEKEKLQVTLDQRDRELRAHLLKVKSLKRTLRDLAYGELKLREASGVMPPDDVVSPAQLTGMNLSVMEKTIPTVTTPLKSGSRAGKDGTGGDELDKTTLVDKSVLDVSGLDPHDPREATDRSDLAFQPSPPPGSAGSRQISKPSPGRRIVGQSGMTKEQQTLEVKALEAKLKDSEQERARKAELRAEELMREEEKRLEVESAESDRAATLLQSKQRQRRASAVVQARREEHRQDQAATLLQSKQRQKQAVAAVEVKRTKAKDEALAANEALMAEAGAGTTEGTRAGDDDHARDNVVDDEAAATPAA